MFVKFLIKLNVICNIYVLLIKDVIMEIIANMLIHVKREIYVITRKDVNSIMLAKEIAKINHALKFIQ